MTPALALAPKHFTQRVINHGAIEMEAVQAAGVVLGMGS